MLFFLGNWVAGSDDDVGVRTGEEDGREAGLLDGVVRRERDSQLVAVRRDGLRQRRAAERAVNLAVVVGVVGVVEAATKYDRVVLAVLL